ncbi:AMP-binding protein [Magnetospirillum sp. UT-4]|uniref:AMP-binding protein n=1 Tax=Magnetospirillum sp. UT-4 TaxID=2681467 RepID=UPI0013817A97|nr:AMP-binding protein [Magnetospirillum sp. UT-4]CAA7619787.1 Acetyl-coenzyme A synthetase [Magnetospirillum sp. UT-4]
MVLPKAGTSAAAPSGDDAIQMNFGLDQARALLCGSGGAVNMAAASVDRHVAAGAGAHTALVCIGRHEERRSVSYAELAEMSDRAAAMLRGLGTRPGDVVAVLLGRGLDLYVAALGAWKVGAVFCPLFTSFGPGPLRSRLELAGARVLIAAEGAYQRKVAAYRDALAGLEHVLVIPEGESCEDGLADFRALIAAAPPAGAPAVTAAADPAFLHFTSGTTGTPKGAVHGHGAVLSHLATGRQVFGLSPDDVYWCTAEPGWITSTAYGLVAPLVAGCTVVVDEAGFDPRRWYDILKDERVSVWYTTPTCIRMMMRFGAALARSYRTNSLRLAASVGEPLSADAAHWGERTLGVPFLDTWWQTETGAIAIANRPSGAKPGSMGLPLPGIEAAVVTRQGKGVAAAADGVGELALKADLPSLFTAYVGDPERTRAAFADGWYLTGDLVRRDEDGYFWFVGRADDMIKTAAQTVGPFELESALLEHPAVAEIGVVGRPDPLVREVPVAFVALNPGFEEGEALRAELLTFARQELGAAIAPRDIHFVETMPKTSTGKILRRELKARAASEPADESGVVPPCPGHFDDE